MAPPGIFPTERELSRMFFLANALVSAPEQSRELIAQMRANGLTPAVLEAVEALEAELRPYGVNVDRDALKTVADNLRIQHLTVSSAHMGIALAHHLRPAKVSG